MNVKSKKAMQLYNLHESSMTMNDYATGTPQSQNNLKYIKLQKTFKNYVGTDVQNRSHSFKLKGGISILGMED